MKPKHVMYTETELKDFPSSLCLSLEKRIHIDNNYNCLGNFYIAVDILLTFTKSVIYTLKITPVEEHHFELKR